MNLWKDIGKSICEKGNLFYVDMDTVVQLTIRFAQYHSYKSHENLLEDHIKVIVNKKNWTKEPLAYFVIV